MPHPIFKYDSNEYRWIGKRGGKQALSFLKDEHYLTAINLQNMTTNVIRTIFSTATTYKPHEIYGLFCNRIDS